ncbi:MAG: T9SS type A sorting domain-containing protein [Lentimicrobium sp.]
MRNLTWIICCLVLITINWSEEIFSNNYYSLPAITSDTGVIILTTHDPWQMSCDVQCGGTITDDGSLPILEYGVCWSSDPEPTISDNHTFNCWGAGSFDCYISEWELGWFDYWMPLYFRAYATNDSGTYYGDEKMLFWQYTDVYINQTIIELTPTSITFQRDIFFIGPYTYNTFCQSILFPPGYSVCSNDCWNSNQICQVDNLSPSTDYSIMTEAFTGCSGNMMSYVNYLDFTTPASVPTLQASNITFTEIQNDQINFNWTDGNGFMRAVFIKQDSAGIANPSNNTTYTADTVFGSGAQIGNTGWYCIFNGNTHEGGVTVTNLLRNTNYRVMVCEYNGIPGTEQYNLSTSIDNPNIFKIIVPAPVTTVPLVSAITNTSILAPVTVTGFDSISAFTLRLEYDPSVIVYTGFSNVNPLLNGIIVNDLPVNPSLHKIMMLWSDVNPVTLPPNSKLLDLDFTYLSDTTELAWNNTANGGSDCEYADATGEPLTDMPTGQYYINGAVSWLPTYQVSGIVKYNNTSNTPLDLVEFQLIHDSAVLETVISNATGNYEFSQLTNGVYQGLLNTAKPWGGVNATDALKVERHVVGLELLTEPVRLMAADVNSSGSINATDALKIKRRVVGFDNTFTRGDWTFAKPVIGGDTIVVNGSNVIQDFYGLCVGDVNGSNNPGPGAKSINAYEIEYVGEIAAIPGTTIELPIRIDRVADISAITMVLQLSPGLFQVQGVEIGIGTAVFNQIGDELRIAWSEIQGLSLNAGDTLFSLQLLVNETSNTPGAIPLWLMEGCELADLNADPLEEMTFIVPGIAQAVSMEEITDSGFSIYPNPASDKVMISFVLQTASNAECYLTDMAGRKLIEAYKHDFGQGQQNQLIDVSNLKPGVYMVCQKVENNGGLNQMHCKRLVIL